MPRSCFYLGKVLFIRHSWWVKLVREGGVCGPCCGANGESRASAVPGNAHSRTTGARETAMPLGESPLSSAAAVGRRGAPTPPPRKAGSGRASLAGGRYAIGSKYMSLTYAHTHTHTSGNHVLAALSITHISTTGSTRSAVTETMAAAAVR